MFDCSHDVLAHHDEKVTLPQAERTEMRDRRDANRERLKRGLKNAGKPAPREFVSQGSYAMKTMTQHPESDYDIDDGVYFEKDSLDGQRGGAMSALQARQFVSIALSDASFNRPPEVRNNCVRVYYVAGYHVDVPVYRRIVYKDARGDLYYYHELASTDWKRSDARHVNEWFQRENNSKSPDPVNGRQLRRIVRQIKKFARSRESWKGQILSGFGITKLVSECYRSHGTREDIALYNTMQAIRDRLTEVINTLAPLFEIDCTRMKALKCWDRVFATTFFSYRGDIIAKAAPSLLRAPSVGAPAGPFTFPNAPRIDDKPRGFGSCGG